MNPWLLAPRTTIALAWLPRGNQGPTASGWSRASTLRRGVVANVGTGGEISVLLVVLMLAATPAGEAIAQQKPEKPAPKEPQRPEPAKPAKPAEEPRTCCRTCSKGKACGDACINRQLTCTKPPGCACDSGAN